ncbi:MAG: helix-turn-helix transcriptional regulator [Proteobacteria bacterium]|nr:helix-turn-helix transcriptional regulator [Pseudomonadota bacterium]
MKEMIIPSPRELEILRLVKNGKTVGEMSAILEVSENTVKYHLKNVQSKFKVSSRVEALISAIEWGFIKLRVKNGNRAIAHKAVLPFQ